MAFVQVCVMTETLEICLIICTFVASIILYVAKTRLYRVYFISWVKDNDELVIPASSSKLKVDISQLNCADELWRELKTRRYDSEVAKW